MEQTSSVFFHDFRQEILAGAEASNNFQLSEFMRCVSDELIETGVIEGFEICYYKAQRGMRADGFWFNDDGVLDLFVADFESREELTSLTKTEAEAALRRALNFLAASLTKNLYTELEITSPEYGLSRQISDRQSSLRRVNIILFSERKLSDRLQTLDNESFIGIDVTYQIWDITRIHRLRSSRSHKEPLDLDFLEMFGKGVASLPAHLGSDSYRSYLVVMPGVILSNLYDRFGARLLEQNVRCFLQARGNVNKGIRATILNEPEMFFAYNNGITATAQEVETRQGESGLEIIKMRDLQIVNGGQTTASLFHTQRKDKATLDKIFVQMKLAVIDNEKSDSVVPRISEYANTQNKVNAADFFSNSPFHVRMEEFSRRIWAPAREGAQRETKWFYERARGQYADAQSSLTKSEQNRFKAEKPKTQMFTKTDLAKFENVWDDHPKWVNLGAQKNFAHYAARIGAEWEKSPDNFNEFYYRRAIARAIIFKSTEKIVSSQSWYNGGYRANIVAYSLALLSAVCHRCKMDIDYLRIWQNQKLPESLMEAIKLSAEFVNKAIINPPVGISNISEWCKKEACWNAIKEKTDQLIVNLGRNIGYMITYERRTEENNNSKNIQKIDNGIYAQREVLNISPSKWQNLAQNINIRKIVTPTEFDIIQVACQIPTKIPTEKQSMILIKILEKIKNEGISL